MPGTRYSAVFGGVMVAYPTTSTTAYAGRVRIWINGVEQHFGSFDYSKPSAERTHTITVVNDYVRDLSPAQEFERALKNLKLPFYPAEARAPLPHAMPRQAPPVRPAQHRMHFASPRVQARRNRPSHG